MEEMSSFIFLGAAILVGLMFLAALAVTFGIARKMFSNPNDKIIQINIDYRFLPLSINIAMAFVLGSTTWYALQKSAEQRFLEAENAVERGFMGASFLNNYLSPINSGKCEHVHRTDGKPVFVAIDTSSTPGVLCGVTHDMLKSQRMVPYIKTGSEYRFLIGSWPFEYSLSSTDRNQG